MGIDSLANQLLPDPEPLELQWHLQRVAAMSGAAGRGPVGRGLRARLEPLDRPPSFLTQDRRLWVLLTTDMHRHLMSQGLSMFSDGWKASRTRSDRNSNIFHERVSWWWSVAK
jgi:hypothetical protein